jgi:hypothetical protein
VDTTLAAEVMKECAKRMRRGTDWVWLGQLISQSIDRDSNRKPEDIAIEVLEAAQ